MPRTIKVKVKPLVGCFVNKEHSDHVVWISLQMQSRQFRSIALNVAFIYIAYRHVDLNLTIQRALDILNYVVFSYWSL